MKTEYYKCDECDEITPHSVSNDDYFTVWICDVCGTIDGIDKQDILDKPI